MGGELRSVGTALRLLDCLAASDEPLGVTELARRLGVAPSTAHRLLATLVRHGFAVQAESRRRYRRGPAFNRLAGPRTLRQVQLRDHARPFLERVAHETRETTHLAVLDGVEVVGLDHVESTQTLIVRHPVGSRLPAHATASGQALLAYSPEATRAVIDAGLVALTSRTITEEAALLRELGRVRRRGFAVNVRQWDPETAGVAAPVLNRFGEAIAALGISGPASRMSQQGLLLRLGSVAEAAASEIVVAINRDGAIQHPRSRETHAYVDQLEGAGSTETSRRPSGLTSA